MNGADTVAALLATPADRLSWRQAVITDVDPTGRLATVRIGGSAVDAGPLPCLSSYWPQVGDTVMLLGSGASILVLGATSGGRDIQTGTFAMAFVGGVAAGTVTFPRAFAGVPVVVLTCGAITGNTATVINTTGTTTAGFSYRAAPAAGGFFAGGIGATYHAVL